MKRNQLINIIQDLTDHAVNIQYDEDGFYYDMDNGGTIRFTLNDSFADDTDWRDFLKERFGFRLTAYNWFTMSILHELGHHFTIEYFTAEEWNKMCEVLDSEDPHEINMDHFNQKNELMATAWAVAYYKRNRHEMNNINRRFKRAFKKMPRG